MKKLLSIILVICMLSSAVYIMPTSVSAAETSGTCGDNLTWSYDSSAYTLTISGSGKMSSYNIYYNATPWEVYYNTIKTVIIADGVTSISDWAFYSCTRLSSVTIGNSVTSIGDYAFADCSRLTSITIPDSVRSIGEGAFYYCTGLTSITIGNSVTRIDSDAFFGCNELNSIFYCGNESEWNSIAVGSSNDALSKATILYNVCTSGHNYEVVETVNPTCTTQGYTKYVCSACGYEKSDDYTEPLGHTYECQETVKPTCTEQGYTVYICSLCNREKNDDYTESLGHSFNNNECTVCGFVRTVADSGTCGNGVTWTYYSNTNELVISGTGCMNSYYYGSYNYVTTAPWRGYHDIIKTVIIEDGVTSIGEYAFYNCTSITSVTIPDSVTNIGIDAFYYCHSLKNYNTYDNAYYLGNEHNPYVALIMATSYSIKSCEINENTKVIYDFAFRDCTELTSIAIPDSVTSIGDHAFFHCTELTSIAIPDSITNIGMEVFYGCSSLKYNTYDNVYYLGNEHNPYIVLIKAESTSITSCKIHENTKAIYDAAFFDCTGLTSVTIPDFVTSIGGSAFYGCTGLTYVTIPDSVTLIGEWAFRSCTGLKEVFYTGTKSEWSRINIGLDNTPLTNANIHYICDISGHDYAEIERIDATCTSDGYLTVKCTVCDATITEVIKGGHEIERTEMFTCEDGGMFFEVCTVCGETIDAGVIPAGHTLETEKVEPTCTFDGYTKIYCTRCGEIIEDSFYKGGHVINRTEVAATCTKNGMYYEQCTVCNKFISSGTIPASHKYSNWVCTVCGDELSEKQTGDVNGDNSINAIDVNYLMKAISGNITLSEAAASASDLNGDGFVNAIDANLMKRMLAGKN